MSPLARQILRPALACLASVLNLPGLAPPSVPQFLLPDVAQPRHYALDLTVIPTEPSFRGIATIDLDLKEKTALLWINGKDLIVDSAVLKYAEQTIPVSATSAGSEFLRFALRQPAGPGEAQLEIHYRGKLSDRMTVGAFRRQAAGDWYAFSTFTAIEARRAFPCFDEPRYKTPWRITLHVKREHVALSNSRALSEREEPNAMKQVVFAETEPLPSSLVAFAAGPFDVLDAGRAGKNGVPVRIITPRGRATEAAATRDIPSGLVRRLEEYTGIPYPFDKLDQLALLEGAFGATEQPGLITYQQRILLAKPEADTAERRRQMLGTMAHELAHQWFGNLVTMSGWEDVWLSEGLATWMAAKLMDEEVAPARRNLFTVAARNAIMQADAPAGARKIRLEMRSREQMREVYGRIVYQKGAAAVRMVESWVGADAFRRGIQAYLAGHKFANATTADFARAISKAAGRDTAGVLSSFLDRPGIPVVTVDLRCDPGSPPRVILTQDPYAPLGAHADAGVWQLPVCVKAERVAGRCVVMESRKTEMLLSEAKACPGWVFPNAGASGYYRTRLGTNLLEGLSREQGDFLTAAERLTFALDISALVANGSVPAADALHVIPALAQDIEPRVALAARDLAGVLASIVPPSLKVKYDRFLQSTFGTPPSPKAQQIELLRRAQQKSLVEYLR